MNKRKISLLSLATITCAVSLIIGTSFAIFTDSKKVNNHLQAGSLEVSLKRVNYEAKVLDNTGLLKEINDQSEVDLTNDNSSLFNINVIPGAYAKATILVKNVEGIAFDYGVRILWDEKEDLISFASQIIINIIDTDSSTVYKEFKLKDCSLNSNVYKFVSPLKVGESKKFDIKASFLDDENNNLAQGKVLDFDMQVFATQVTNKE